jgi:hypothetical protein
MHMTRHVDIIHWIFGIKYELGSLAFLPNLSEIKFPNDLQPHPHLLSVISSHPRLSIAQWDSMMDTSFLTLPSSPADALSRIHINNTRVILTGEGNRVYSSTGDISVHSLVIRQMKPPKEFSLTFSNLSRVSVHVHVEGSPSASQPLQWFPAFTERHPKLTWIEIVLWPGERALNWRALKDVPVLTSLCDAVHRQRLLSSFSLITLAAGRNAVTDDQFALCVAEVELESSILDVIRCIGSSMPVSRTLALKFTMRLDSPPISVVRVTIAEVQRDLIVMLFKDDFVSVFHQSLPDQARLYLCSISRVIPDYRDLSARRDPTPTVLFTDLARLLASGMPKLEHVIFSEVTRKWNFSVKRGEVVHIVNDDD